MVATCNNSIVDYCSNFTVPEMDLSTIHQTRHGIASLYACHYGPIHGCPSGIALAYCYRTQATACKPVTIAMLLLKVLCSGAMSFSEIPITAHRPGLVVPLFCVVLFLP
jgi:hypothetical protein